MWFKVKIINQTWENDKKKLEMVSMNESMCKSGSGNVQASKGKIVLFNRSKIWEVRIIQNLEEKDMWMLLSLWKSLHSFYQDIAQLSEKC